MEGKMEKAMTAPVRLYHGEHYHENQVLIDNGAAISTDGVIDLELAQRLSREMGLPLIRTKEEHWFTGFGKSGVQQAGFLWTPQMRIFDHEQPSASLLCTPLGKNKIILGKGWMRRHGMTPSPPFGELWHHPQFCCHNGALERECRWKLETVTPPLGVELPPLHGPMPLPGRDAIVVREPKHPGAKRLDQLEVHPLLTTQPKNVRILQRPLGQESHLHKDAQERRRLPHANLMKARQLGVNPGKFATREKRPQVSMVDAQRFVELARQQGAQLAAIHLEEKKEADEIMALSDADFENSKAHLLPQEYNDLIDVVSRERSDTLPQSTENDCKIQLIDGKAPGDIGNEPIRRYTQQEHQAIRDFIREKMSSGFIRQSMAGWGCAPLLVKKPDGSLRVCIDYRRLNALTKRDTYPLPRIDDILAMVTGAKHLTRLDVRQAFFRNRMSPESEELTTFRSPIGSYCFRVMPFGITNGPSVFQRYINRCLLDAGLGDTAVAYVDDIIIFGRGSLEEHKRDVRRVLQALITTGLQIDLKKCEFHVQETKLLGVIVSTQGIKMDPAKVAAIKDWAAPRTVKHVQEFLGFCNFYRRFIEAFGDMAKPLTRLTQKGAVFTWTEEHEAAFQAIKDAVVLETQMNHYRRDREAILETDASDWCRGAVLSQYDDEGILRPVAFLSKNFTPAELNYEIYDKELLAIVKALEEWRAELEGTETPVKIFTDHKALEYFATKKKLTRRHARWAEVLASYNFRIYYRKGRENAKADALSRRPNDEPSEGDKTRDQTQVLLAPEKFDAILAIEQEDETLPDRMKRINRDDARFTNIRQALKTDVGARRYRNYADQEGLLTYRGRLCVPDNQGEEITQLMKEVHDQPAGGHPGKHKTLGLLRHGYFWPKMADTVAQYVRNCHTCSRMKHSREKYNGLLKPLPIPERPWLDISCDFVTGLPACQGYDAVLTVVDRFSKMKHYIPCTKKTKAPDLARLFICHVWRYHGLPRSVVSDRGPQFVSEFWRELCRILGIKVKLSTAAHPETDGQSEIANKELVVHLRTYCNHHQDDWVDWLPTAEFADNATDNASTQVAPFELVYGFLPRMSFDWTNDKVPSTTGNAAPQRASAKALAERMDAIWREAAAQLRHAQENQIKFANRHRKDVSYEVGEKVFLSSKDLATHRPSAKLEQLWFGPYPITAKEGNAYRLDLPESMKVHPVFHPSKFKKASQDPLPGQLEEPQGPVEVDAQGQEHWEVERIVASSLGKPGARGRKPQHPRIWYRIAWKGWHSDDPSWYPEWNLRGSAQLLDVWHRANPTAPGPPPDLAVWLRESLEDTNQH
jgi:transposase InsO family protein